MQILGPVTLFLILCQLAIGQAQQGCTRSNAVFVEGARYTNTSLDQCQEYCKQSSNCNYFTWNLKTRGCGIRPYQFSGVMDAPGQFAGTPYTRGIIANQTFVGSIGRTVSVGTCAQICSLIDGCRSWTWFSSTVVNSSNLCITSYENATTSMPVNVSGQASQLSNATLPSVYSGVQSCQEVNEPCTSIVNNNICCLSSLPFVRNCGGNQNGTSGVIKSPNYPSPYGDGLACVWNVYAPNDTVINVTFTSFDTEDNDRLFVLQRPSATSCIVANETFFAGSLARLPSFLILGNSAAFYFYTDGSGGGSGFSIYWNASKQASHCASYISNITSQSIIKNCGSNWNTSTGSIQSPNYPNIYGNNNYCEWSISTPPGTNITIIINTFDTETNYDRLFILDTAHCAPIVPALSGGAPSVVTPQIIATGKNAVTIFFYTDSSGVSTGFSLNYTTKNVSLETTKTCASLVSNITGQSVIKNCGGDLATSTGTIQSPNFPNNYGNNNYCEWTIRTQPGSNITIVIDTFSTEAIFDRLFILDLATCSQIVPAMAGSSPTVVTPQIIATGKNEVSIFFYTDSSSVSTGFSLNFTTNNINKNAAKTCASLISNFTGQSIVKNCGGDLNTSSGTIHSPNYPNNYGNNNYCEWTINSASGTNISLIINSFSTEANFDKLYVLDTAICSPIVPAMTGSMSVPQIIATGRNAVTIFFYTDSSGVSSGFNLTYTIMNVRSNATLATCGSVLTNLIGQNVVKNCGSSSNATSGTIQSPNYPNNYGNNHYCEWTINSPAGTNITIILNAFDTEAGYDRLFILDTATCAQIVPGMAGRAPAVATPKVIPTGTKAVTVVFYSDGSTVAKGFNLIWRAF